ncbi:hypothetical protein CYMTET_42249 [Cymbomonas tetramitiformis]|uniref:Calcineurin-like phosphoesterase domain-containing protein n=1 Tax=Cymbomonas tetramitiformis TaxID=36881 RepID=A0AAE0C6F9_9CHLO|nr:hypothetical protein CYMTET_42249 [Cymbomonas tetramitiformis]
MSIPSESHGTVDGVPAAYYGFQPHPAFRFLVLDTFDISKSGWPDGHPHHAEAVDILEKNNPNTDKNNPTGLVGVTRRFVAFSGGLGAQQMAWLEHQLMEAASQTQRVVIFTHCPICPECAPEVCLAWNYKAVLDLVHKHKDTVKAVISGHTHSDAHHCDEQGIHHRVVNAALECSPGRNAFGHMEVYPDRMVLHGVDRVSNSEMVFVK